MTRKLATDTGARPDLDDDEPDSPADLSTPSLWAVVKRVGQQFSQDGLGDLAAALTYYAVLSIVPGLIVLISILGLLGPDITTELSNQAQAIAPGSSGNCRSPNHSPGPAARPAPGFRSYPHSNLSGVSS